MSIVLKIVSSQRTGPDAHHLIRSLYCSELFTWGGTYLIETRDKRGLRCRPHLNAMITVRPHGPVVRRDQFYADPCWEL